jgi:hypothetical protein
VSFVDLVNAAKEKETNTYSSLFLGNINLRISRRKIKENRPREREENADEDVVSFPKYPRKIIGKREKEKQERLSLHFCTGYIDGKQKSSLLFFPILCVYMRMHIDIELDKKKE